jgi:hypothetical protein
LRCFRDNLPDMENDGLASARSGSLREAGSARQSARRDDVVFIITQGCPDSFYDDNLEGHVFSSRELADAYVAANVSKTYRLKIEEMCVTSEPSHVEPAPPPEATRSGEAKP